MIWLLEGICPTHGIQLYRHECCGWCPKCKGGWSVRTPRDGRWGHIISTRRHSVAGLCLVTGAHNIARVSSSDPSTTKEHHAH